MLGEGGGFPPPSLVFFSEKPKRKQQTQDLCAIQELSRVSLHNVHAKIVLEKDEVLYKRTVKWWLSRAILRQ